MATPSHFLNKIKIIIFRIKIELAIEWETHEHEMRGPHKVIRVNKDKNVK